MPAIEATAAASSGHRSQPNRGEIRTIFDATSRRRLPESREAQKHGARTATCPRARIRPCPAIARCHRFATQARWRCAASAAAPRLRCKGQTIKHQSTRRSAASLPGSPERKRAQDREGAREARQAISKAAAVIAGYPIAFRARSPRPARTGSRRKTGQPAPQTSRAVSITSFSLAAVTSGVISLPSAVLENPHCGDRHI